MQEIVLAYVRVLQECGRKKNLEDGKRVHARILHQRLESDIIVASTLVSMYAKCGSLVLARQVFDIMPRKGLVAVNALASGYVKQGRSEEALDLFQQMRVGGIEPDGLSFVAMLNACAHLSALEQGKHIHAELEKAGYESNLFVSNALIDMYSKCRSLENALRVFEGMRRRDVVSWNAIIAGCVKHGHEKEAIELFQDMKQEGLKPDGFTFVSMLNACASLAAIELGKQIHVDSIEAGLGSNCFVAAALVDMYAKCRCLKDAHQVFDRMHKPTAAAWTAMISGYVRNGQAEEALKLSQKMQQNGFKPDAVTYVTMLNACATLAALEQGRQIHGELIRDGFHLDLFVSNALIDMYAKCGSLREARKVFNSMRRRNVVSWTAMILGYAIHGNGREVIQLFRRMQEEHVEPNEVTFVGVLSACSRLGLLDEGLQFFRAMIEDYGVTALSEHYGCMVDLYGRAGHLGQANDFIQKMPIPPDTRSWTALLAACKMLHNLDLAEGIAEHALKLEPQQAGSYVLLSDIYASTGRWDKKHQLRKMLEQRAVTQDSG
ncbi:hypothetical protein O6H91_09G104100 [Diphasiastrum complanatum]|uniref:Uncharacterized protein n=1 Tax=Diphasiastrum complanatum TaxID=34168 RepID=A0ACC2CSQ2_DIPCM|nr:hypothetical protein O6H91_09G104100 [Diphasiastrum complanatum]